MFPSLQAIWRVVCFGWATISFAALVHAGDSDPSAKQAANPEKIATFSIVAVDPESGVCGAAVSSMYPAVGKVVPHVRAGVGAICTQHWGEIKYGPRGLDLLAAKKSPHEVIASLLAEDSNRDQRQLAVIDTSGRVAQSHPVAASKSSLYWGGQSGRFYAVQGNTLAGRDVIQAMAKAYESTDGSLADRMMAALIAGDCAGGDHRGRLAAGIRVAKPGVAGNWLELDIDRDDDAVIALAKKYAELTHEAKGPWRGGKLPFDHPCPNRPAVGKPRSSK